MIYTSDDSMRRRANEIDDANWEADKADCARRRAMTMNATEHDESTPTEERRTARVLRIRADGWWEFRDEPLGNGGSITLDTIQEAVGGYIEATPVTLWSVPEAGKPSVARDLDMFLNEEGKLIGLPLNLVASRLARVSVCYGDPIVGDVLICAHDREGNSVGISAEAEDALQSALLSIVADLGLDCGAE